MMHYYQFNIGDYQSHTSHLSEMEDLAYRRMLDWCYLHEKPLPLEIDEIARLIRMRSHSDCIAVVLREYFERNAEGWVSLRVIAEILKVGIKSDKASASAKARWGKKDNKIKDLSKDANALRTQSEGNATQDTLPNTQDPLHKTQKKDTAIAVCPINVDEQVWSDFLALRKVKKAPMTVTALAGIKREADKAGWPFEKAIAECVARGWTGFKADWVADKGLSKTGQTNQTVMSGLTRGLVGGGQNVKLLRN
jgi:uncharacterized protein YdaU (DUF1376 family)